MYCTYILRSLRSNHYYTGCTSNIKKRLEEHNTGKCEWIKKYSPWKLHFVERLDNRSKAFAREKYLKSHAGIKWIEKGPVA